MRAKSLALLLFLVAAASNFVHTSRAAPMRSVLSAFDDCDDRVDHRLFGRPGQLCVIDGQESRAARGGRGFIDSSVANDETQDASQTFELTTGQNDPMTMRGTSQSQPKG